jgi:drug/metabolite transporter (DMT)-like permease
MRRGMTATVSPAVRPQLDQHLAFAALVLGAAAMGVSPLFVRIASAEIGPFASAFWRVLFGLPLLYLWARLEPRGGRLFSRGAVLAGLAFTGDLFFWHLSIMATSVANATFFATTAPVFVVLITAFVFRTRVPKATFGGLALCLAGGAALIGQSMTVAPEHTLGDLYGVATAFFFGLYFLAVSGARRQGGAGRVTFALTIVTALLLFVVAQVLDHGRFWPTSGGVWLALVALGGVSHAGGQGLLSVALGRLPAVFSSLVIFLEAVVAALAGWIVLGEALGPAQYAGGALILVGIWVARPRRRDAASAGGRDLSRGSTDAAISRTNAAASMDSD